MNKYQKALNYINKSVCTALACLEIDDKQTRESLHTIQGLIDQTKTPTLEEVKKEWEKLEYKWKEEGREITLEHKERITEIYIDKIDKAYYSGYFLTFQELNLLTKTFRTFGWVE